MVLKLLKIQKSKKPTKKYTAILLDSNTGRKKKVHFGSSINNHYKDSTGLGAWSHKNHLDKKKRANFKKRFERYRHNKYSPAWFSDRFLW